MAQLTTPIVDTIDQQKVRFVDVDGVRTRYYEDGSGEAILLFHGGNFGSIDSFDSWSLNFAGLAKHFHVYAVDKLGQGHTDNPKSDADYTFESLFRHAHGLVQALGIDKAHFVGHSRGGLLVTNFALEHPDLVSTVTIVDSNTTAPESPMFPSGVFYSYLPAIPDPPTREAVRSEPEAQSYSTDNVTEEFVSRRLEIALLPKTQEIKLRMEALNETVWTPSLNRKRREVLRKIDEGGVPVPTLVAWGVNDPSAPSPLAFRLFEQIAARTPRAELHVINGAGHYSFREQPEAFNRMLRSFCLG